MLIHLSVKFLKAFLVYWKKICNLRTFGLYCFKDWSVMFKNSQKYRLFFVICLNEHKIAKFQFFFKQSFRISVSEQA